MRGIVAGLVLSALLVPGIGFAAGASPLEALSLGAGVQGKWLDEGGQPSSRAAEAAANLAVGITQHLTVTGGTAYGFDSRRFRYQIDGRIAAVDKADESLTVWVGAGRYWTEHLEDGMDEWAGKAGIGYRVPVKLPLAIGLTAAYGLDTGRRSVTAALVYVVKATKGVAK